MATRKQLGNYIRDERERRSWSQAQLSEIAGLSIRTIQRTETTGRCSHETLLAVAAAFDLDVAVFTQLKPTSGAEDRSDFLPPFVIAWLSRRGLKRFPFAHIALTAALLTSAVALLSILHGAMADEGSWLWMASKTVVCSVIIVVGILTWLYFSRESRLVKNWLMLFSAMSLLVLGAAGAMWGVHMAEVTGDMEAWAVLANILLIGQGTATILSLHS